MQEEDDITIDEEQTSILESIIEPGNKPILVKVPKDNFKDDFDLENKKRVSSNPASQTESSLVQKEEAQDITNYSFNVDGFESNSIAYFNELLLGYKSMNNCCCRVDFDFNDFLSTDISTINYCSKMLIKEYELIGDIDAIIKNVKNEELKKAKKDNPYSIFTSKKFFDNNDNEYDIFCESTFGLIEKLKGDTKNKPNRKLIQLKKLIYIINFINEINEKINDLSSDKEKNLKKRINEKFHHKIGNKIILCMIVDGNYKNLIEQIKNCYLFSKDWKDNNENGIMKNLYEYFSRLRKSKIPFLIVYCPRFYERNSNYFNPISKTYIEDKSGETEIKLNNLVNENAQLKIKINNLEEDKKKQENDINDLKKKLEELENKFNQNMNYVGKKRNRPGANKKIIKVKKTKGIII